MREYFVNILAEVVNSERLEKTDTSKNTKKIYNFSANISKLLLLLLVYLAHKVFNTYPLNFGDIYPLTLLHSQCENAVGTLEVVGLSKGVENNPKDYCLYFIITAKISSL